MAINSTPTTSNQSNDPGTPQVGYQEHLTWIHKEPLKGRVPHSQFTIIYYTTLHVPRLARHSLPHQYCIHTKDLGNKLPRPTNIFITYGRTQTRE